MAYKIQASFSAGELDPALWERTTLDKYKTGLRTLRNAHIGKTGRIISRPGSKLYLETREVETVAGTFTADAATDICTRNNHFLAAGAAVTLTTTNTLPAGLALATTYYVVWLSENSIKLATTEANAYLGAGINITSAGTGVHTIVPADLGVRECVLYAAPYLPYVVEWGHTYARIHNTTTAGVTTVSHSFGESDLPYIQFFTSGIYTYVLRYGKTMKKMVTSTGVFSTAAEQFNVPTAPTIVSYSPIVGGPPDPTGYSVQYMFTYLDLSGEESAVSVASATKKLPILAGESTTIVVDVGTVAVTELRVYRRPLDGNAYGYIGSTTTNAIVAGQYQYQFVDYGGAADYAHNPPAYVNLLIPSTVVLNAVYPANLMPRAGIVYQQKLLLTSFYNEEASFASRTGFQENFYRDYPLASDSGLAFKCGTTGSAKVLRYLDNGGLLIFTTVGIYKSSGALTPDNLSSDKIGNWVIEEKVPPLEIPGGILFIDKSTNTVRTLIYSNEAGGYPGDEVSIYSNHLFLNKTVVSWAFQDGDIPLVWVVFDDGSLVSLTYQREQQMQAWSRHDTYEGTYESVCVVKNLEAKSVVYFVVKRGTKRYIEYSTPRFVADLKDFVGVDSAVSYKTLLAATVTVTPVIADTWDGTLTLTAASAAFANTAGNGAIGTVFQFFDPDGYGYKVTVTAYTSTTVVTVTTDPSFPEEYAVAAQFYKTFTTLTGLTHLEGQSVSVLADGYVVASPLNFIDNYTDLVVTGGSITLPDHYSIIHVGLPIVSDIETLDVDTVEQKPTLLESSLAAKINMSVYDTRATYVAANFPEGDNNAEMVDPEERLDDDEDSLGNRCQQPYTRRLKFNIPGDWKSNGRVCIRQVDPLPMEILSLIPDLEIYRS